MPSACVVIGCKSTGGMRGRRFFRFPMIYHKSEKTVAITQARQFAWVTALNRAEFFPYQYQYARVCDLHFISGESAHYSDVDNPDWIPSKNLGYVDDELNVESDEELSNESTEFDSNIQNESLKSEQVGNECLSKETQTEFSKINVGTQTEASITGMSIEITLNNQEKCCPKHNVTLENFRGQDRKTI